MTFVLGFRILALSQNLHVLILYEPCTKLYYAILETETCRVAMLYIVQESIFLDLGDSLLTKSSLSL